MFVIYIVTQMQKILYRKVVLLIIDVLTTVVIIL